jgi:hypothetical protein
MPKYTRMLCWVTTETKNKILETSEDLPIIFSDNYKDFKREISKNSYLAIDLTIAHENLDNLRKLFENFPELKFYIIRNSRNPLIEVCDVFTDFERHFIPNSLFFNEHIENFKKAYLSC